MANWRYPANEDWTCPKELDAPNQQEVVQRDLHSFLPLSFFLSYLVCVCVGRGWKD